MPTLTADNRNLTQNAKYSHLSANYQSGETSLVVTNSEEYRPNDFILIGEFGSAYAEIRRVTAITRASDTLTINIATSFPHSESTKVTIIHYDQVRFFHTTTATFSSTDPVRDTLVLGDETTQFDITNPSGSLMRYTYDDTGTNPEIDKYVQDGYTIVINGENFDDNNKGSYVVTTVREKYFEIDNGSGVVESDKTIGTGYINVLTNYLDIDTSLFLTSVRDADNSTGFGWFTFYNSYTESSSQNSNAIPYGGFDSNSASSIIENFFSLLNNKQLKLVTNEDAFAWLSEAYAIARNELNLVNREYTGSDEYDLSIISGTKEYALPDSFSDLLSIVDSGDKVSLSAIKLSGVSAYDEDSANTIKYYLRGAYIGFTPTPTATSTYTIRYIQKGAELTSMYDTIDLPENNHFCLVDYMMFRAAPKLGRNDAAMSLESFNMAIGRMKTTSIKRNSNLDSWTPSESIII